MKRRELLTGITFAAGGFAIGQLGEGGPSIDSPALASDRTEQRILNALDEMRRRGGTYLAVPPRDGRWLRVLTEATAAQHVVEIGTSTGYSGLWIALALTRTGGRLTTYEIDVGRAETARGRFTEAGVEDRIALVVGDAHDEIGNLAGPVDIVFIDADKPGYPDYLNKLEPIVRPGGLILAHNVTSSPEYLDAVTSDPRFETLFPGGGNQLAVTLKKL